MKLRERISKNAKTNSRGAGGIWTHDYLIRKTGHAYQLRQRTGNDSSGRKLTWSIFSPHAIFHSLRFLGFRTAPTNLSESILCLASRQGVLQMRIWCNTNCVVSLAPVNCKCNVLYGRDWNNSRQTNWSITKRQTNFRFYCCKGDCTDLGFYSEVIKK